MTVGQRLTIGHVMTSIAACAVGLTVITVCGAALAVPPQAFLLLIHLSIFAAPPLGALWDMRQGGSGFLGGMIGGLIFGGYFSLLMLAPNVAFDQRPFTAWLFLVYEFSAMTGLFGFATGLFAFMFLTTLEAIVLLPGRVRLRSERSAVANADRKPARGKESFGKASELE